jgi:hypothetical protein
MWTMLAVLLFIVFAVAGLALLLRPLLRLAALLAAGLLVFALALFLLSFVLPGDTAARPALPEEDGKVAVDLN